jgi:2-dehydropantoate 2-reductase
MNQLNSLIVGPGAIGALVCAHIQPYSSVVVHTHRSDIQLARLINLETEQRSLNWALSTPSNTAIDVIWVCCKANQVEPTLPALLKKHPNAVAILLHNGLGPQYNLVSEFGSQIIKGSTTCGALSKKPFEFTQTSFGHTDIGFNEKNQTHKKLKQLLCNEPDTAGPMAFRANDNIEAVLWRKVLINACINPITAYYQIPNGRLLDDEYRKDIQSIIDEVNQIMIAKGLSVTSNTIALIKQIATLSRLNYSSMSVDVKNKRLTEIDFINGFLIKEALKHHIATPSLEKWYKRIASLPQS